MTTPNEWDAHAADWDADPGPRAYAAAAFESLGPVLERHRIPLRGLDVLDFGCGTGLLTEHLVAAGAVVDAVDTSPAMIEVLEAKISERAWSTTRATTKTDIARGPYGLIVASSVLSFVEDHRATVADLAHRLVPDGVLVHWDWERQPDDPDGHGLTRQEILIALWEARLVGVTVDTAFSIEIDDTVMSPLIASGVRPFPGEV